MHCPRCQSTVLEEIDRSGVTLDRCPSCRGIWLDRGELEKITARATAELEGRPVERGYDRGDHHDREPPSSRRGYGRGHKKSFWHDIFD